MKEKRIDFIDVLRGFAIFLIVFGHAIGYSKGLKGVSHYLSSFYVPLFFFVSGYLFVNHKDESIQDYGKKKARQVLIPYVVFAILSCIPFYLLGSHIQSVLGSHRMINRSFLDSILAIFYASGHSGGISQNSPLWFLPCYFTVVMIGKILAMKTKKNSSYLDIFFFFFFFAIGGIVYHWFNFSYPFCLETALVMLGFYFLGKIVRSFLDLSHSKKMYILGIISILLGFLLQLQNGRISCMNNDYQGHYFIFFASASLSSFGYFCLFSQIKQCKFLQFLGKHTIPILVVHKMFLIVFQAKAGSFSFYLKNGPIFLQFVFGIVISVFAIGLSILTYKIIDKFFPIVYGEKLKPKKIEKNLLNC